MTVLDQLNIIARDFDATVEFYRRLGMELKEAPGSHGIRHAEAQLENGTRLEIDNGNLARIYNAAWRKPQGSSRALIGFSLPTREAVDALYGELMAAGHAGRQKPHDAFWGARYAVVADPDGNDVGLTSPIDESRKQWPPGEAPG
jgi:catechol 2,3-dioxygenase-like lactoylglutathione lyase family enzyme